VEVLVRLRKLERLDKDQYTDDERGDAEDIYAQRQSDNTANQMQSEDQ
jgi:hypothetical protein